MDDPLTGHMSVLGAFIMLVNLINRPTSKLFTVSEFLIAVCCCISQVDKHIRRLDSDLARFEAELKERSVDGSREGRQYHLL